MSKNQIALLSAISFLACMTPASAETLDMAQLSQRFSEVHASRPGFDAAAAVEQCVREVQLKVLSVANEAMSEHGMPGLSQGGSPVATVGYTERFSGYGAHLFVSMHVPVRLGSNSEESRFTDLSYLLQTTSQESVSYQFVRKGEAIQRTLHRISVIPSIPSGVPLPARLTPAPGSLDLPQDRFSEATRCVRESSPTLRLVHEFPRCVDPADHCGDGD